jgi:hypothetical protein
LKPMKTSSSSSSTNTSSKSAPEIRPNQQAEVRIPMDEIAPKIRQRSPRRIMRPASDLIDAPSSSATPPPPLPPRPNSMINSGLGPNKVEAKTESPQIPTNFYPPEQSSTSGRAPERTKRNDEENQVSILLYRSSIYYVLTFIDPAIRPAANQKTKKPTRNK